jgi:large subunit ribosomal protein L24
MKIKKNDKVQIISGKDKGKQGKVLQVFTQEGKVSIEGLNLKIKHMRPRKQGEKGQKIQFPAPLRISNIMFVCPRCNRPTRIGYKILMTEKEKNKIRVCKKCKTSVD